MKRFGPNPHEFFANVYKETPPWDIGGVQPALAALLDQFPPEGPALDVGCGSGDHAIALAQRGLETLGIDFVESAVSQAAAKATALPAEVAKLLKFRVADALRPSLSGRQFGTVLDSGFFHLFDVDERAGFVLELSRTLRQGGRIYMLEFAMTFPHPNSPKEVTQDELCSRFSIGAGWRILAISEAQFQNRIAPVAATCACIERLE